MSKSSYARTCGSLILVFAIGAAQAAQYCCPCKGGEPETVDASDDMKASFQCTVACKRFTLARPGACEQAAAPAASPAAAPAAAPASGGVMVYRSADCSGDALRLDKSTAQLEQGAFYSFAVESGAPASAFAQANYSGMRTQPIGPSICVSPGFSISAIRLGLE
jgi:hypothetical protein